MKIGLVLDDTLDKTDGVQQAVLTLGNWLRLEGHVVHYLVADTVRTDISNVHSLGRFVNLRYNKNNVRTPLPASRRVIKDLLKKEQFDVLHIMLPYSPFLAKQVIRNAGLGTAVVGTFHILPASRLHGYSNKALRILLGRSLKRFDKIVAVSEPAVHFARSAYGINATYVPNPIVTDDFRSGKRLAVYGRNKLNILFLGRLVKRKGILELIKAYNALDQEAAKHTRLIIGGKGPLRQKAKNLVSKARDVIFAGYVSEKEKADFLASADIAVFPSISGESFGIVLVEAMAAGAGVVLGGNNPGYKSVLGPQPYLLLDPLDTAGFAEHLKLFIDDEKLRKQMHEWQEEVVGQYDIGEVGSAIVKIYKQCLQARADMR
ncbi:phosphatidyl-myo-inositol alpha-mannosyltransferase [soil metagenome]